MTPTAEQCVFGTPLFRAAAARNGSMVIKTRPSGRERKGTGEESPMNQRTDDPDVSAAPLR